MKLQKYEIRAVARGIKLGGCKLSICRLVGMAFGRAFLSHTHILFVERLNFLTTSGVAMFLPLKEGGGVSCEQSGQLSWSGSFPRKNFWRARPLECCRRLFLAQAAQSHARI